MRKPNRSYRMTVDYREWSHGDAKCKCSSRWVSVLEQGKNTLGTWYEAPVLGNAFLWFQVAKLIGFTWWGHQYTCTWGFMSGLYKLSCSLLYYSPQELNHLDSQRTSLYFIGVTVQIGPGEQEVENILGALVSHMHFRVQEINPMKVWRCFILWIF